MPLTEEEKRAVKKYQNLSKKTSRDYSFKAYRKYPKGTIEQLLEFKHDPNYNLYLDVASKRIDGYVSSFKEELDAFPPHLTAFQMEDLIIEDVKEHQEGISRLSFAERERRGLRESPYYRLLTEISSFPSEEQKNLQEIWKIRKSLMNAEEHLCVLTPDTTQEDLKTRECDFGFGLRSFIEAFKKTSVREREAEKWKRQFIPTALTRKYFNVLKEVVDETNVEEKLTELEIIGLHSYVRQWHEWKDKTEPSYRDKAYKLWSRERNYFSKAQLYWDDDDDDFDEPKIKEVAMLSAKSAVRVFVAKNTEKVAGILKLREDCNIIKPSLLVGKTIEGTITVKCENEDEFTVKNQLVHVVDFQDPFRRPFYRYPTTFHNIRHKDEFFKMRSERWMNEDFTVL